MNHVSEVVLVGVQITAGRTACKLLLNGRQLEEGKIITLSVPVEETLMWGKLVGRTLKLQIALRDEE